MSTGNLVLFVHTNYNFILISVERSENAINVIIISYLSMLVGALGIGKATIQPLNCYISAVRGSRLFLSFKLVFGSDIV